MGLVADFDLFKDKFGMTSLEPGQTSQNGALFTMEYLICLINSPLASDEYKQQEINRIKLVFNQLECAPGLSVRFPGSNEFDSMDNTIALYVFSGLFDNGEFAKRAYDHGINIRAVGVDSGQGAELNERYYPLARLLHGWKQPNNFWNNNDPELFCLQGWHGRSPGHMALLKLAAGKPISLFDKFSLLVGQFIGVSQSGGHMDSFKLPYVLWQILIPRGWFWKKAYQLWGKMLLAKFPGGMQEVYSKYYLRPDHPIRTYSKALV